MMGKYEKFTFFHYISTISQRLNFIYALLLILCLPGCVEGRVEILNPYYPFYIKSGSSLTVLCQSSERTDITWIEQTPRTSWKDTVMTTTSAQDFTIEKCIVEPTGFTKSTVVRSNMSLDTRGMYLCRDATGTSSYAVWVTVLHINIQIVAYTEDMLGLRCTISGFDSNLPTMDYDWTLNDSLIPHPHDQSQAAGVVYAPGAQTSNNKYNVTLDNGVLDMVVTKPVTADGGTYNCSFTLGTNLGRLTFVESIYINGSKFTSGTSAAFQQTVLFSHTLPVGVLSVILLRVITF